MISCDSATEVKANDAVKLKMYTNPDIFRAHTAQQLTAAQTSVHTDQNHLSFRATADSCPMARDRVRRHNPAFGRIPRYG